MKKYRIIEQVSTNETKYIIQHKFLWFWVQTSINYSYISRSSKMSRDPFIISGEFLYSFPTLERAQTILNYIKQHKTIVYKGYRIKHTFNYQLQSIYLNLYDKAEHDTLEEAKLRIDQKENKKLREKVVYTEG